ncbi:hypothetical protein UY3_12380 [Chelonia mydas]|uniref:Uncharacterized protein n=1 Tax=Chelonia mydas TaxID=8469 RepID=M7AY99_CHEMY|nr:hypothetical protein UY3_12380 [Chelonia mydas]
MRIRQTVDESKSLSTVFSQQHSLVLVSSGTIFSISGNVVTEPYCANAIIPQHFLLTDANRVNFLVGSGVLVWQVKGSCFPIFVHYGTERWKQLHVSHGTGTLSFKVVIDPRLLCRRLRNSTTARGGSGVDGGVAAIDPVPRGRETNTAATLKPRGRDITYSVPGKKSSVYIKC